MYGLIYFHCDTVKKEGNCISHCENVGQNLTEYWRN